MPTTVRPVFRQRQRLRARQASRRTAAPDERGLALLDVLLGMAIFALVVVIGVQNFSTLRGRAYTSQVSSDAKQVATAIQAKLSGPNASASDLDGGDAAAGVSAADFTAARLTDLGVNLTAGNQVGYVDVTAQGDFTVCVRRGPTGPAAIYTSATSVLTTNSSTGCPTAAPPSPVYAVGSGSVPCPHYSVNVMRLAGTGDWYVTLSGTDDGVIDRYARRISGPKITTQTSNGASISTDWTIPSAQMVAGDTVTVTLTGDDYATVANPDTVGCGTVTIAMPSTSGTWAGAVSI